MAKNTIPRGETSVIRHVFIQDSTVTTGAGKTGLAYNTGSLTGYYIYPGGTATSLTLEDISTLGTYAAPTSNAHLRIKEISSTNMPGWYELQFHNDWFSVANARRAASVQLKGATGMAPVNVEIDCIGMEIQSATPKTDVETIKTNPVVNGGTITFPTNKTLAATDNITGGTITTTTNLTNLPAITNDWLTAAGVKADAVTKIQNGLATPTNITSASGIQLAANQDVRNVSGTITDKTGYAIGNGGIAAAAFAAGALDAAALNADAGTEIANAIKAAVIEAQGSYTIQQALSIILAVLAGVTADNGATLKTPNGSATRVAATIDANANRTAMTLTPSA